MSPQPPERSRGASQAAPCLPSDVSKRVLRLELLLPHLPIRKHDQKVEGQGGGHTQPEFPPSALTPSGLRVRSLSPDAALLRSLRLLLPLPPRCCMSEPNTPLIKGKTSTRNEASFSKRLASNYIARVDLELLSLLPPNAGIVGVLHHAQR